MKNTRSLHELYKVLWEKIKYKDYIYALCVEINELWFNDIISLNENELLKQHFKSQKPSKSQHSEFIDDNTWCGTYLWWNGDESTNPVNRKRFIQKMIEITKP